jgi:hypothetical protein
MPTHPRDPTLQVLLDLDGQVLVVDPEGGHWVRFIVRRVEATGSTTLIRLAGNAAAGRRIIGTGCET